MTCLASLPDSVLQACRQLASKPELSELSYFIYDLDGLKQHLQHLQQQNVVKLWYAVKANPLSKIVQQIKQANLGFDVASRGELNQVLAQGVAPQQILNTGPAKSLKQIKQFLQLGVRIFVAESMNQLNWLQQAASELQIRPKVLLRCQLSWQQGERNPLGGDQITVFGLSPDNWRCIKLTEYNALNICGLHIFQWGNIHSAAKLTELWQQMVPQLQQLAADLQFQLQILDLGGGLGLDYQQSGNQLVWQQVVEALAQLKQRFQLNEIWMELGRFAVGNYGYYCCEVIDKKQNYHRQQLVLSGGINHLIRPAITQQMFPVRAIEYANSTNLAEFDLHGPLCTSLDLLGTAQLPTEIKPGDKLLFGLCGAYGFTESMPFFLCHELAAEFVIHNHKLQCVRNITHAQEYLA